MTIKRKWNERLEFHVRLMFVPKRKQIMGKIRSHQYTSKDPDLDFDIYHDLDQDQDRS